MDKVLEYLETLKDIPPFHTVFEDKSFMETEERLHVLQMNIGRKCNLACKHCHVCGGPARTELMSREVMEACIRTAKAQQVESIDITGGAPEMNPDFEWLVEEACKVCSHVMVRTNLVILNEPEYKRLIAFYAAHKIEMICSLPHYRAREMERVRGKGTFDTAINVIQKLNELGYGRDPELVLNMVYNPAGAFFPPDQVAMEREYKVRLKADFGIDFNNLFTLYNNPIGRFGEFLIRSGNMAGYMNKLYQALNTDTLPALMCRSQISVDYDGTVYDCDFNLALKLPAAAKETIFDIADRGYRKRNIVFAKHCYACTAGQGSS